MKSDRREFLLAAGVYGAAVAASVAVPLRAIAADDEKMDKEADAEISAPEDLMREHGVLDRILLVYEEGLRRMRSKENVPPDAFHRPAALVRSFVEDYHEQLEETFIFPRFEKGNELVELVGVLRRQHAAGRRLTDIVLRNAVKDAFTSEESRQAVTGACRSFIRMYRPHAAREDTVLFPALYGLLGGKTVKELGEQFEEQEHRRFGEGGFHKAVEEV
ncbi:MAG: hemerythrin domain-containing protein, partial [bacterium]